MSLAPSSWWKTNEHIIQFCSFFIFNEALKENKHKTIVIKLTETN